jgi:myo-inositol catabolism protein IolC
MTARTSAAASQPLFILAMDHRESLGRVVYGISGEPTPEAKQRISAGKRLVFAGLSAALGRGTDPQTTGVLVDERYGAEVARAARAVGLTLAMPIERSGQHWFMLEFGTLAESAWLDHLAVFDPHFAKVLVRDNPDFDESKRRRQQEDLAKASAALRAAKRPLLLELLVPATDAQRATHGARYDIALRPELTERVMRELQSAGVEPDIWKIEGLDRAEDAARMVVVAQAGGRSGVRCIVLGRDAPAVDLDRWLRVAAGVEGFRGFAIGRSIWEQPLMDQLAGKIDEQEAIERIAASYQHYVSVYSGLAAAGAAELHAT